MNLQQEVKILEKQIVYLLKKLMLPGITIKTGKLYKRFQLKYILSLLTEAVFQLVREVKNENY